MRPSSRLAAIAAVLILASCGPSPAAVAPTSTPAASPSVPAAPTATPAPKAHDLAIAAFVASVETGRLSYRVTFKGKVSLSADTLPIAGRMDVSGADFASAWTYDFDPDYPGAGKIKLGVRGVKGKGYVSSDGGAWKSIKGYKTATHSYVPFRAVATVEDVTYLGPTTIDGKEYHKVSIPQAVVIDPTTIPFNVREEKIDGSTLDLVIDAKGRPISGAWELMARARVGNSGQLQRVEYELALTFSKIGAKFTIKRP
jgi:hypothetical protein